MQINIVKNQGNCVCIAQYANCIGNHQANFVYYSARQKAKLQAQKEKTYKNSKILKKTNNLQL